MTYNFRPAFTPNVRCDQANFSELNAICRETWHTNTSVKPIFINNSYENVFWTLTWLKNHFTED